MQENSQYRQLNAACCKFEKSQKIILVAKELNNCNINHEILLHNLKNTKCYLVLMD